MSRLWTRKENIRHSTTLLCCAIFNQASSILLSSHSAFPFLCFCEFLKELVNSTTVGVILSKLQAASIALVNVVRVNIFVAMRSLSRKGEIRKGRSSLEKQRVF